MLPSGVGFFFFLRKAQDLKSKIGKTILVWERAVNKQNLVHLVSEIFLEELFLSTFWTVCVFFSFNFWGSTNDASCKFFLSTSWTVYDCFSPIFDEVQMILSITHFPSSVQTPLIPLTLYMSSVYMYNSAVSIHFVIVFILQCSEKEFFSNNSIFMGLGRCQWKKNWYKINNKSDHVEIGTYCDFYCVNVICFKYNRYHCFDW